MAFGLKSLFKGVKSVVKKVGGSVIGSLIGGPLGIGAALGSQIGGIIAPRQTQAFTAGGPAAQTPFLPTGGFGLAGLGTMPAVGRAMLPSMAGMFGGERNFCPPATISPLRMILCEASNNVQRRVTAKQIIEAARVCGLEVAAQTFGLDVTQVCTVVVTRRRRRGRGISATDLRRTRSTIRKVVAIQDDLAHMKVHRVTHRKRK